MTHTFDGSRSDHAGGARPAGRRLEEPYDNGCPDYLADCSGLVMAGGEGRRMGGQDKGLLPWGPRTLAAHAAERLGARCQPVLLSVNRHLDHYAMLGCVLVQDLRHERAGPLAALEAALYASASRWLIAVPCDSPLFPSDLPDRLYARVTHTESTGTRASNAAYARCAEKLHPAFCILETALASTLTRFLDKGGRRMTDWWQTIGADSVDFGTTPGMLAAFANANTPEAYQLLCAQDAAATASPLSAAEQDFSAPHAKDLPC